MELSLARRRVVGVLAAAALVGFAGCDSRPREELLAIVGATIYRSPTEPPIVDGVVLVRDGLIEGVGTQSELSIPKAAKVIDGGGMYLMAGFQNSHVHFTEPGWHSPPDQPSAEVTARLQQMLLRYGFTTVVDTGSPLARTSALRDRVESGSVLGPRILTAGTPLYPDDGIPFYLKETLGPEVLAELHTPATTDEAIAIVADQIEAGTDLVKLFVGSWVERGVVKPMSVEIATAAVDAAHERDRLVWAHASNIQGLEIALEAGVDVLAHALDDDRGWGPSYVARMHAGDMAMVPTLKLFGGQPYTKFILLEVRDYVEAGGPIFFGTDVGFLTDYDPTEEYNLMADSGMDWRAILASLTTAPANRWGESDRRGRIASGLAADLVLLDADPSAEPAAFSSVRYTLRRGRVVYEGS